MTTLIIKDNDSELSLTRETKNLEEMLQLFEDSLRGLGFNFKGSLIIEEEDDN